DHGLRRWCHDIASGLRTPSTRIALWRQPTARSWHEITSWRRAVVGCGCDSRGWARTPCSRRPTTAPTARALPACVDYGWPRTDGITEACVQFLEADHSAALLAKWSA